MATKKTTKKVVKSPNKSVSKKKDTKKKDIYSTNVPTAVVLAVEALILLVCYLIIMNM